MTKTVCLNSLPFEVNLILFGYLDINTLLNVRQVNKKFKCVVEKIRIKNLCVHTENQLIHNDFVSYNF